MLMSAVAATISLGLANAAQADITYVDASSANTTVNGAAMVIEPAAGFNVGDGVGYLSDDLWSNRTGFGINGSMFQAHASLETVTDILNTTVSRLANGQYHVYAYMLSSGTSWDIQVDLNGGAAIDVNGGDAGTVLASTQTITAPFVEIGGIPMWAVDLGTFTGTSFTVNVDQGSGSDRTWYDGVGFSFEPVPTIPEPTSLYLVGMGIVGLVAVRRRRRQGV